MNPTAIGAFCRDVTAGQMPSDLPFGWDAETLRLLCLMWRMQGSVTLVGEYAEAQFVARRAASELQQPPDGFAPARVVELCVEQLVAPPGEFTRHALTLLGELAAEPTTWLLVRSPSPFGTANEARAANEALRARIAVGVVRVLWAVTQEDFLTLASAHDLTDVLTPVFLGPLPNDDLRPRLVIARERLEAYHRVHITDAAVQAALRLGCRHLARRSSIAAAAELLDTAATDLRVSPRELLRIDSDIRRLGDERAAAVADARFDDAAAIHSRLDWLRIERDRVAAAPALVDEVAVSRAVAQLTGVRLLELGDDQREALLRLEETLSATACDPVGVASVARAVRRWAGGLSDPDRPVGVFLASDPMGEAVHRFAVAIADVVFGDAAAVIRYGLDPSGLDRLIVSIRRAPFSVVVLDGVETADATGRAAVDRLLDGSWREDFRNAIVFLTKGGCVEPDSGLRLGSNVPMRDADTRQRHFDTAERLFRPGLVGRIDDVLLFREPTDEDLIAFLEAELASTRRRLLADGITLVLSPATTALLIAQSGRTGRGIRRTARQHILDPIAILFIRGEFVGRATVTAVLEEIDDEQWVRFQ